MPRSVALQVRFALAAQVAAVLAIAPLAARASGEPVQLSTFHKTQKVFALAQTPDGFVWAGTDSGLLRYDGRDFRTFTSGDHPGLRGNIARALTVDRTGTLWIGFDDGGGLSRLSRGRIDAIDVGRSLHGRGIVSLGVSRAGVIFIGTDGGLFRHDPRQPGKSTAIAALAGHPIYAIEAAPDGNLWVGAELGLYRISGDEVTRVGEHGPVYALAPAADGTLWLSDASVGLYLRTPDGHARVALEIAGLGDRGAGITALTIDRDGALWVGWNWGYGRLHGDALSPRFSTALHSVDLLADSEGGVWNATYWGVVFRAGLPRVSMQVYAGSGENPIIFGAGRDRDGAVWFTHVGSVVRASPTAVTRFESGKDYDAWCPRAIASARAGGIWMGSCDLGIVRFNPGRAGAPMVDHLGATFPPSARNLQTVFEDSRGTVWMGTEPGELYRLDGRNPVPVPFPNGRCDPEASRRAPALRVRDECGYSVTAIAEARAGGVWLTLRRNGLRRVWVGGHERFDKQNGLPTNDLISLHEDGEGTLWIGTQAHGLVRFRDGQFRAIARVNGLPAQSIHGITEDDQGQLWMSSEAGILRVEKRLLEDYFAGRIDKVRGFNYGLPDGLTTLITLQSFSSPILFMPDGRLLVPTDKGLATVHGDRVRDVRGFADAVIDEVRINGADAAIRGENRVDLPFGSRHINSLEIRFTVPNFAVAHRIEVDYRLAGLETEWRSSGSERVVRYFNVPPGTYTFELQTRLDEARFGRKVALAPLVVRSFYQRPIFFVLLALLTLPLVGLGYIIRLRYQRGRFDVLLAERNRIARDLHDSLAQYFTGMSYQMERLSMVVRKDPGTAEEINEETKVMLAQCRLEARQAIHNLRSEQFEPRGLFEALHDVAAETRLSGSARVDFESEGDDAALAEPIKRQLVRIAQEATVNALTHANATRILIHASADEHGVRLAITDNGAGFAQSGLMDDKPLHFGLQGMRERAEAIGGAFHLTSSPGGGTQVEIRVST